MIVIDGARGEGGGQILRSSLALSLITGLPFRMDRIRAGRQKAGLLRQHLTGVKAAAEVGQAAVEGAELGSQQLVFRPGRITPGDYKFAIGSAGSATLVLQTVLPALMQAEGPSTLRVEGGTHNSAAPPFDFLAHCFLPILRRMGPSAEAVLERPGFYPAGGGIITTRIVPAKLTPIELIERGEVRRRSAMARVAGLARNIADREVLALRTALGWGADELRAEELPRHMGPGNVVVAMVESEHVTEVFTGFGERGVSAESVAQGVAAEVSSYLAAGVPVGEHLADQLLLPMAMSGAGVFRSVAPSLHTTTQIETLRMFLDVDVSLTQESVEAWRIEVKRR
jgi:RNA 3'-terminal phosphate cyclase (ATP)